MFTDQEISAYHNIKAPSELREKIIYPKKRINKTLYFSTVVAACFIFIISGVFINSQGNNIVINGQKLKDSVEFYDTTSSFGRAVSSEVSIPVEIKTSRSTKIFVKQGLISIDGSDLSNEIEISSTTMLWWAVEPDKDGDVFEMIISDKKGVQKVTLRYENSKITASKEKEK